MNRRSPPPTDGEQSHFLLGSIVRNGFSSRRGSDPVPLAPSAVRTAMVARRRGPGLLLAGAGLLVAGAGTLAATGWFAGPAIRYTVERAPGAAEKKLHFSDGSTVTTETSSRMRVVAAGRRGARLRLEDGSAHLHLATRPRADWALEVGPYNLVLAAAELDVSWSANHTNLTVALLSGSALVHGPFAHREGLRIKAGETLVARASDGFWRVGRGRQQPTAVELQARDEGLALGAAPAGLPSRLGAGPADSLLTSSLVTDGRCNRAEASTPAARHDDSGADPWAWVDRSGCLGYSRDAHGNRLPDFSHAGYRGGGVSLPFIARAPGSALVLPGKRGDDTAALQAAIDAVAARTPDASGFRGVVELGSGTFTLSGSLRLMQSGVVLRGQGAEGAHPTILRAVGMARPVVILGSDDGRILSGPAHKIAEAYVPVGARTFELDSTEGLRVDDDIVVQRPFSQKWLALTGMDRIVSRRSDSGAASWRVGSGLTFERRIVAIEGNRITVDVPLTNALEREYTDASVSKYTFPTRTARIGIERLASRADFDPESDLGDGMFIEVNGVMNSWVREVHSDGYESGLVSLEDNSKWITVADVVYTAGPESPAWARAFSLGGQQNLIMRARSVGAHHALGTLSRSAGPNVVMDLTAVARSPVLTPNRWTAGLLLDNVHLVDPTGEPSGEILMRMRGGGRGGGWSAANSVVWNSEAGRLMVDSPPTAQNWVIGAAGGETAGNASYDNSRVPRPESLYRAQLAERLGESALAALAR
jgi:hypothetical protein